jgi:hypothetical protein
MEGKGADFGWRHRAPAGIVDALDPNQLLDELVGPDDASRTSDETGKDHPFLRPGDRQRLPPVVGDLERSKDEEPHGAEG